MGDSTPGISQAIQTSRCKRNTVATKAEIGVMWP